MASFMVKTNWIDMSIEIILLVVKVKYLKLYRSIF